MSNDGRSHDSIVREVGRLLKILPSLRIVGVIGIDKAKVKKR
jgi:hypothetical protein